MKNEIAILMAAGLGSRMLPLTEKVPKPLIKVFGKSMIETIIDALEVRGVKHIYVVVGYKKEQFEFLQSKYSNVTLIENQEYTIKNNISSIYAVADIIGKENCFICEADLYVADPSILEAVLINSCYYGKMVQGWSDDWGFDLDKSGRIVPRVFKKRRKHGAVIGIENHIHDRTGDAAQNPQNLVHPGEEEIKNRHRNDGKKERRSDPHDGTA